MGWDGNILLSDMYLSHNVQEGMRAKMSGVYALNPGDPVEYHDGDEINVGSKSYTIHHVFARGSGTHPNCFPTEWVAAEQIIEKGE
ncbi:hypothetical protein D3C80_1861930 [compost metagenome]